MSSQSKRDGLIRQDGCLLNVEFWPFAFGRFFIEEQDQILVG